MASSTIFSFSDEGSGGRGTGRYCRPDVGSSASLRMTQRTLRLTVASLGITMAEFRPREVMKMGCRRAVPPGPSSLTRGPIWDLRDPGIGVAPRPWVPAFAGKTVGGWPPEQSRRVWGSRDRGLLPVGRRFFDFAQNDTENAQNDSCFAGMTVASPRIVVHALLRRHLFGHPITDQVRGSPSPVSGPSGGSLAGRCLPPTTPKSAALT